MPTVAEQQQLVREELAREQLRGFESAPPATRATLIRQAEILTGAAPNTISAAVVSQPASREPTLLSSVQSRDATAQNITKGNDMVALQQADQQAPVKPETKEPDISALLEAEEGESPEAKRSREDLAALDQETERTKTELDSFRKSSDAASNALINSLQNKFEARRMEMRELNRRRAAHFGQMEIRFGSQFAPGGAGQLIAEEERQGIMRIAEIDAEEATAIADVQKAIAERNFKVLQEKLDSVDKLRDEKRKTLEQLNKDAVKKNEEIRKRNKKLTNEAAISAIADQLQKEGKEPKDSAAEIYNRLVAEGIAVTFDDIDDVLDTLPAPEKKEAITGPAGELESARRAGLVPDWITALPKSDQLGAWVKFMGEQRREGEEPEKPKKLSVLDLERMKELYGVDLPYGTTEDEAEGVIAEARKPREFKDKELRQAIRDDKTKNVSYEDVIDQIDANAKILNKDRAKLIASEIYGKKKEGGIFKGVLKRAEELTKRQKEERKQREEERKKKTTEIQTGVVSQVGSLEDQLREFNRKLTQ